MLYKLAVRGNRILLLKPMARALVASISAIRGARHRRPAFGMAAKHGGFARSRRPAFLSLRTTRRRDGITGIRPIDGSIGRRLRIMGALKRNKAAAR